MKHKYDYLRLLMACCCLCAGLSVRAQGPKSALHLNGSQSIQSDSVAHNIATGEFTWEAWVKPATTSNSTCVMTNSNYSPGFYASTRGSGGDGSVGVYWSGWKNSGTFLAINKWSHIAIVRRVDTLFFYVNGIQAPNKYTISGKYMFNAKLRLGWSGDAGEYFSGDMDEVRVWTAARSVAQLRAGMCMRLTGTETNLEQYYRLDEGTDTVAGNAVTGAAYRMTKVPAGGWVASGAAIGDTSVYAYPGSWSGVSLQLSAASRGVVTVDSFGGSGAFAQFYRIGSAPAATSGLTDYKDNNVYYGVFAPDSFTSYPRYNYSTYATAVANKGTIRFFLRNNNADTAWTLKSVVYNNTTALSMRVDSLQGARQMFLANFVSTCSVPSAPGVSAITATSAQLNWTTGGAALWNIQYDTAGFTLGTGHIIKGVNTNPYVLSGIGSNRTYQYYVQDSCTGLGSSSWAGPFTFSTPVNPANLGSGTALTFNGAEGIATDSVVKHNIGRKAFTYEVWVKPTKVTGSTGVMSNGSYAPCLYATTAGTGGDGSVGYYLSGKWKNSGTYLAANKWAHIAMVRANDTITIYVNGIAAPNRYPSTDSILNQKMTLGWSRDVGEYFQGDMDEVRVWTLARTEKEIRDHMCQKLKGDEAGLISYYRLNDAAGAKATDLGSGAYHINTVMPARWTMSGAPVGDSSNYLYAGDWTGKSLNLAAANYGTLNLDSVNGTPKAMFLYSVDSVANTTNGITTPAAKGGYYGVFVVEQDNSPMHWAHYNLAYSYGAYALALSNEANIRLYNRSKNADTLWTDFWSVKNTTAHTLKVRDVMLRRELIIGEMAALGCAAPQALHADTLMATYARIGFTGSPANWNVQYGPSGFAPGTGIMHSATTTYPALLDTLNGTTLYDVYVQQNCGGSASKWSGPYTFMTKDACPDPSAFSAAYLGDDSARLSWTTGGAATWNMEYGLAGFIPGSGVPVRGLTTNPYVITGLFPSTSYDFYIQDTCMGDGKASRWIGPVSVTTKPPCFAPATLSGVYLGGDSARLTWTTGGASLWNMEYGPAGFVHGSGTFVPGITATTYVVTGLSKGISYDFYVQDSCTGVATASNWSAPASVLTSGTNIAGLQLLDARIFPNPANQSVTVRIGQALSADATITITSIDGKPLQQMAVQAAATAQDISFSTGALAPGIYLIHIGNDRVHAVSRLTIIR